MNEVYVTVEDAIARILKFDYVLDGVDLFETLLAFMQDAENEYEEAQSELLPEKELEIYKLRVAVCEASCEQAESMRKLLSWGSSDSMLKFDSEQRLELDSVAYWAAVTLGVEIVDHTQERLRKKLTWPDITIKIRENNVLDYLIGQDSQKQPHFRDIDLMGRRKKYPNRLGGILIGLSGDYKFPAGAKKTRGDSVAIAKIRVILKKLTGINSDPFYPFNERYGWRPVFNLIDARRDADKRTEKQAIHESYDETKYYDIADDVQEFIDKNS